MARKRSGLWAAFSTQLVTGRLNTEVSAEAFKLWTISVLAARAQEGTGEVRAQGMVRLAGVGQEAAAELLDIGYWHERGHSCPRGCAEPREGYVTIHAYLDWQDSPEEIAQRTSAGRAAAQARWSRSRRSEAQDAEGMPAASDPNTEQNRTEQPTLRVGDAGASAPRKTAKRATPPPAWVRREEPIPERLREWIAEQGVTNWGWVDAQLDQINDWAVANGKTWKDWEAGVRNWLRRSLDSAGSRPVANDDALQEELREWLRVHPCPVPAELEPLEATDGAAFQQAMVPVRAAHRERGLAELRRGRMRSVR